MVYPRFTRSTPPCDPLYQLSTHHPTNLPKNCPNLHTIDWAHYLHSKCLHSLCKKDTWHADNTARQTGRLQCQEPCMDIPVEAALNMVEERLSKDWSLGERISIPAPQSVELMSLCLRWWSSNGFSPVPGDRQPVHEKPAGGGYTSSISYTQTVGKIYTWMTFVIWPHVPDIIIMVVPSTPQPTAPHNPVQSWRGEGRQALLPWCPGHQGRRETSHFSILKAHPHGKVHSFPLPSSPKNWNRNPKTHEGQDTQHL